MDLNKMNSPERTWSHYTNIRKQNLFLYGSFARNTRKMLIISDKISFFQLPSDPSLDKHRRHTQRPKNFHNVRLTEKKTNLCNVVDIEL